MVNGLGPWICNKVKVDPEKLVWTLMIFIFGMVCFRLATLIVWTEATLLPTLSLLISANQTSAFGTLISSEILLFLQFSLGTDGAETVVRDIFLQ